MYDGCSVGVFCEEFGVLEGVVCAIFMGEVMLGGGLIAPNLASLLMTS